MRTVAIILVLAATPALAQTSTNYKLRESVFNAGGDPLQGSVLASASYHVKLDSIGEGIAAGELASASYGSSSSFVSTYAPPGEVQQLVFSDKQTIQWHPEKSIGQYELYRDAIAALLGGSAGSCFSAGLLSETATDAATPSAGQGYFYLATARNRLGEEGTKGFKSNGMERPNVSPCP